MRAQVDLVCAMQPCSSRTFSPSARPTNYRLRLAAAAVALAPGPTTSDRLRQGAYPRCRNPHPFLPSSSSPHSATQHAPVFRGGATRVGKMNSVEAV
nr:unnamed protein product [Digitaria exilis]